MKSQTSLRCFYLPLVLSILILSLGSCNKDKYDPDQKGHESGTLSDIDGNIYPTVVIGEQLWMAANLRTTRYRDGSVIDYPGDDTLKWQNNKTGAYAWQSNNEMYKDVYGGLYNWQAVNNSSGLCPSGWRVSTPEDWSIMMKYLLDEHGATNDGSGINPVGNILKSCRQVDSPMGEDCNTTDHPRWEFHNTYYGTDDFGFAALPGGNRRANGVLRDMGLYGFWWMHDPINDTDFDARYRYINYDQSRVFGWLKIDKNYGLSVRCVKN